MAKAGQGYKSDLNLGLSQTPKSSNPEIFNDLIEIYNATHTLNAAQSALTDKIFGLDKDAAPDESMPCIRSVWLPVDEAVEVGNCLRWNGSGDALHKGQRTSTTMIALTAATPSVDDPKPIIRVGFGPFVLKVDDLTAGTYMWTTDGGDSLSNPYRGLLLQSGTLDNSCIVGRCFINGYLLFCPGWYSKK